MTIELLFCIIGISGIASKAFLKLCSNMVSKRSLASFSVVLLVNSAVACTFFYLSSGFNISINAATLLYSLAYAIIAGVSIISNIVVYRYASISGITVISSSCSMICTAAVGGLLFDELINGKTVIRLFVMLIAMTFVFAEQNRRNKKDGDKDPEKKNVMLPLILTVSVIALCGVANTVILKSFAASEAVTDNNSFFFFTNVILGFVSAIIYGIAIINKREEFRTSISLLKPRKLISVAGNTICSNISSLITVLIVAKIDISFYSPIASAIGILTGVIGSLIFREKQGVLAYIAALTACIAIVI